MALTSYIPLLLAWSSLLTGFSDKHVEEPAEYPKNIVLMIGDGMGLTHISAAMHHLGSNLVIEDFPVVGLQKTYSGSHVVTDSGAGATAMACGVKTYNSGIGVTLDSTVCNNLMQYAEYSGKSTGVVVTSSLVNATPAAFIGHQKYRGFQEAIASDYMKLDLDYMAGGGMVYFTNRYSDDRNIWDEMEERGYTVSSYAKKSYKKFAERIPEKAVYFTAHDKPLPRFQGRDYLPTAVGHALKVLGQNTSDGFFLLVEGSQIDHASHANNQGYLLSEMRDFEQAIEVAKSFAEQDGETLVIVTADHATGGVSIKGGKPYKRVQLNFSTKHHTADIIPVFAFGPGAELFHGLYENTEIFEKIRAAGRF